MRPQRTTLLALGIVTASTLMLQVVVTRLFSASFAYHFSFLAISLAMLGTGAGSLMIYVRPRWFEGAIDEQLARWSAAFAGILVLAPIVLVRLELASKGEVDATFVAKLFVACVATALPSVASGVVVALVIARFTESIGSVYAWDLLGAGIGALIVVPVLGLASAPVLMVALGLLAAVAAVLFAPTGASRRLGAVAGAAAALVLLVASFSNLLYLDGKYGDEVEIYADRWTPLARVLGLHTRGEDKFAAVIYDRVYAPVPIVSGPRLPGWHALSTGPQSIGYLLTGPGRALVIGGGGGRDIYTALTSRQRPVHVIELNEGIVRVVDEDLAQLSRSPYTRPGVVTRIGDGRSVLSRSSDLYDQIHLGFTDTLSANAAQGYALTENNLYTLEAFDLYFDHLAPGGILNVSRLLKLVGDEAIRATVLTLEALKRRGIEHPERNMVVILGQDILGPVYATILARLDPFSPVEIQRIRVLAEQRGRGLAFAGEGPYQGPWKDLARAESLDSFVATYPLDISPPTDDRPFFFNMHRWGRLFSGEGGYHYTASPYLLLMLTLVILLVLSLLAFVLPLGLTTHLVRPSLASLGYFAAIGLGFMLLEVVVIQYFVLFLGFPTYALSVVLASLLVFSGCGSWLTTRVADARRGMLIGLSCITLLIGLLAFGLQPLLRSLMDLPFGWRLLIAFVLLAPLGVALGTAMPFGLRRFSALHPTGIAYAWGVNGITSVLASVLGIAIAVNFGFTVAALSALACYAVALAHALRGEWPNEVG